MIDPQSTEPHQLAAAWLTEAGYTEPSDPTAACLATRTATGVRSRVVLIRGFDRRGFVFYTNLDSAKGRELKADPQAALLFYWKSTKRQLRIEGEAQQIDSAEADAYFQNRPRDSQLGAWASQQSQPLNSREELMAKVEELRLRYLDKVIPRPPFWSGFRLVAQKFEFWHDGPYRLHDRFQFTLQADGKFNCVRLYP